MTPFDRDRLRCLPPTPEPIRSHGHAVQSLKDIPFVLYAAKEGAKLAWSLVVKRWPELR